MSRHRVVAVRVPFRLHLLVPPYSPASREEVPVGAPGVPFGAVVLWPLQRCAEAGLEWQSQVRQLRQSIPFAPVAGILDGDPDLQALDLARRAAVWRLRAVVPARQASAATLRAQLAAPAHLPDDLAEWAEVATGALDPATRGLLTAFLEHATLNGAAPAPGSGLPAKRPLRARLRAAGLPPPVEWKRFLRTLRLVLTAQAEPALSLTRLALEHGYPDLPAASHAFHDLFGLTLTQGRQLLGWEALAACWLARSGAPAARRLVGFVPDSVKKDQAVPGRASV